MKKKLEELKALVLENDGVLLETLRRLAELEKKLQELADAHTIRENCIKNMLDRLAELERWKEEQGKLPNIVWFMPTNDGGDESVIRCVRCGEIIPHGEIHRCLQTTANTTNDKQGWDETKTMTGEEFLGELDKLIDDKQEASHE